MNTAHIHTDSLDRLKNFEAVLEHRIKTAEQNNKKKQEYQEEFVRLDQLNKSLKDYERRINFLHKSAMDRVEKFRDEIISNLEARVESILAVVYPEENFKVSITFRVVRGAYHSEVLVGKEMSNGRIKWGNPKVRNGEFMQQLISFSMVASMNLLLGSKFLMMDEPFSSSDPNNVALLKPVLEMMLENGLQILLIEHKENLFRDIDHNEIRLLKHRHPHDEHKGFVEVISTERIVKDEHSSLDTGGDNSEV